MWSVINRGLHRIAGEWRGQIGHKPLLELKDNLLQDRAFWATRGFWEIAVALQAIARCETAKVNG